MGHVYALVINHFYIYSDGRRENLKKKRRKDQLNKKVTIKEYSQLRICVKSGFFLTRPGDTQE